MTDKRKSIVRMNSGPEGFGSTPDSLEAEEFSSDIPLQHSHSEFEDADIGLYVGLWDTESFVEAGGPYACDEFMWLLEGECEIRNNRTGAIETVKAGMPFVIPKGYDSQWQQHGYLKKYYVISEHPAEDIPATPSHEGVVFPKADAVEADRTEDAAFTFTSGTQPRRDVCYADTTGRFTSGTWASQVFESELSPLPYNHFAYVHDGSISLIDADGAEHVFNVGDAFFIPKGVMCRASVAHNVRLYFASVKSS